MTEKSNPGSKGQTTLAGSSSSSSSDTLQTVQMLLENCNVFDGLIALVAIIANAIVLRGITPTSINLLAHRRFLTSLLSSNLYMSIVNIALIVMSAVQSLGGRSDVVIAPKCVSEIVRRLSIVGFIANLLSLNCMAIDHFIGILRPIQYKQLMSNNLARSVVFIIWALSFVIGFADFPYRTANYLALADTPDEKCSTGADDLSAFLLEANNSDIELFFSREELMILKKLSEIKGLALEVPCDTGSKPKNWCDYFNGSNDVWLQLLLVGLACGSLVLLGTCCIIGYHQTAKQVDRTKQKLRRLLFTAFLLLATFFIFWSPLVSYEIAMVLVSEMVTNLASRDTMLFVHKILFSLYNCSPLFVPLIYIARNRAVRLEVFRQITCGKVHLDGTSDHLLSPARHSSRYSTHP